MNFLKKSIAFLFFLQISSYLFAIEYVWTGADDGISLYKEGNWSNEGSSPAVIDALVPITFDIKVNSGTVGGSGYSGTLLLGGHTFTLNGGAISGNLSNAAGIASFYPSTGQKSFLYINGGSIVCDHLIDLQINLKNCESIQLYNTNDPLAGSTINIDSSFSGNIVLNGYSIDKVRSSQLSKLKINGENCIENQNVFLKTQGSGTIISLQRTEPDSIVAVGNKDYSDTVVANNGPNIIYILMDDLGYGDLGKFWQNQLNQDQKMATPMLDKLASEGCMITQHYCSAPVCAPSRASFLEGLNQGHSSVRDNQFDKAAKDDLTLAAMLQKAGYRTMHVGKNGLSGGRTSGNPAHPLKRGFDQFYGYLYHNQGHEHYPQNGSTVKEAFFTDGYTDIKVGTDLTYTTDVFTAKAKQWIADHESKRPQQPFFLYLAYDVPHMIMEVPTQAYPAGRGLNGGLQWTSQNSPTPWVNTASGVRDSYIYPEYASKNWPTEEKKFATMIRRVDDAVDDIIQLLKDLNIDNNTLLVFSSDNGPHLEGHNPQFFKSYAFMDGTKRDMWEGGIKMPTICRYPGVIPTNSEVRFPSGQWDWLATFAELAGVPIPVFTDGVSLLPSITQHGIQQSKGYLYHEYYVNSKTSSYADFEPAKRGRTRNQMQVIRLGDYKGVRYNITSNSNNFEIYNIATDPKEVTNLAPLMTDLQKTMKDKVLQVRIADPSATRPYDTDQIPGVVVSNLQNGLTRKYYAEKCDWVPNFDYLTALDTTISTGINLARNTQDSCFGFYFTGYLQIPTDGDYTFYLQSAAKCHVMLHDIHLLNNDFNYSPDEQSVMLRLKNGMHPIRIYYQQNSAIAPVLSLKLQGPGISKTTIPNSFYYTGNNNTVSTSNYLLSQSFCIYPQPALNQITAMFNSVNSEEYSASIYTLTGKKVSISIPKIIANKGISTTDIAIDKLPAGIYILELKPKSKRNTIVEKFVKM